MYQLISIPYDDNMIDQYGGAEALAEMVTQCGCDGIEWVWGGQPVSRRIPEGLMNGYHLTFFNDWMDYYLGRWERLEQRFGEKECWRRFYEGNGREDLERRYRQDLQRALTLRAPYTVFHVSDVSIEETYTYRFRYSNEEVIDTACRLINNVYGSEDLGVALLLENLWWPGFRFTQPELTERMLSQIHYPNTGIMLDTGHLMNCNQSLRTQEEACCYILEQYRAHGPLKRRVRGLHLHQSLSGEFAAAQRGTLPEDLPRNYVEKFCYSYTYIQKIDTHQPFTSPAVQNILKEICPEFLVHELASGRREQMLFQVQKQKKALNI